MLNLNSGCSVNRHFLNFPPVSIPCVLLSRSSLALVGLPLELVINPGAFEDRSIFVRQFTEPVHSASFYLAFERVRSRLLALRRCLCRRCKNYRCYPMGNAVFELALVALYVRDLQGLLE